ncbi:hypothetical protein CYMTET_16852 [Cymbomonas tetramitiformis]|uniref:Uncharacterized protein n=1 Tax=Cymbomonas tetramitiformis TaxID=36881 RepID=A0AAE0GCL0_9CHLO|nr:hypothetical protein CYMTET_16852 [Cymbomonas tetramitiformis]
MGFNYMPVGRGSVSVSGGSTCDEDASLTDSDSVSGDCASLLGDEPDQPGSVVSPGRSAVGCGKMPASQRHSFLISLMVCALFCFCATAAPATGQPFGGVGAPIGGAGLDCALTSPATAIDTFNNAPVATDGDAQPAAIPPRQARRYQYNRQGFVLRHGALHIPPELEDPDLVPPSPPYSPDP